MDGSEVVDKLISEIAFRNKTIISADDPIMVIVTALHYYSSMLQNGNDDLLQKNAEVLQKNLSEFEGSLAEFANTIVTEISNSLTDQIAKSEFKDALNNLLSQAINQKLEVLNLTLDGNIDRLNEVVEKHSDKSSALFSSYERNFNKRALHLQKIVYMLFGATILVMLACLVVTLGVLM